MYQIVTETAGFSACYIHHLTGLPESVTTFTDDTGGKPDCGAFVPTCLGVSPLFPFSATHLTAVGLGRRGSGQKPQQIKCSVSGRAARECWGQEIGVTDGVGPSPRQRECDVYLCS